MNLKNKLKIWFSKLPLSSNGNRVITNKDRDDFNNIINNPKNDYD